MPTPYVPPELLEDIFSQLSSSKSALYHLSVSCRTFHHICKPFLYSHITINTGEERSKLKQVKKEDAQLVKKFVIKREKSSRKEVQMDGKDNSIGSGIMEDLFIGELLDISVIEVLHVIFLYEDVNEQPNYETLEFRPASNLVELSIRYHHGGGSLWTHVLEDDRLCPSLSRLGSFCISAFRPNEDVHSEFPTFPPEIVGGSGEYELESISLYHHSLGARLSVYAADCIGKDETVEKDLVIVSIDSSEGYRLRVPTKIRKYARISIAPPTRLLYLDADTLKRMLVELRRIPIKSPSFLSLPFSRSDFSPESRSTLSSIEDLGIDLHFSPDEEEEDSNSVIPQSFVKFVEKQKKLKEEKEREEGEKEI